MVPVSERGRLALESLKPELARLNESTEGMAATLDEYQAELRKLGVGVSASVWLKTEVPVDLRAHGEEGFYREEIHLEYRNGSDGWGLYIVRFGQQAPNLEALDHVGAAEVGELPIAKASRELKHLVGQRIDDLLDRITERVRGFNEMK
jgi:hypothetical protein